MQVKYTGNHSICRTSFTSKFATDRLDSLTDRPRTIFMALVSFGMEPQRYRTEPRTPGLEPERKEGGVAVMAVLFRRLPAFYRSLTGQCSRLPCLSINQAINQSVCRSMMNSHLPSPHSRLHSFHNVHPPPHTLQSWTHRDVFLPWLVAMRHWRWQSQRSGWCRCNWTGQRRAMPWTERSGGSVLNVQQCTKQKILESWLIQPTRLQDWTLCNLIGTNDRPTEC